MGGFGGGNSLIQSGMGGAVVGFAVKSGLIDKLPAIPVIGRIGAAALLTDYYAKHGGGAMARTAANGLAFLAGYQLGTEGTIHGDDEASPDSYETYEASDEG